MFLWSTCCLYSCGNTSHRLLSHEQDQLDAQTQQYFLPSQHILRVLEASSEVKAVKQSLRAQHNVEVVLSVGSADSLRCIPPSSLTAKTAGPPLKVTQIGSFAFFRTQSQEACASTFASLPSHANSVSPVSIPAAQSVLHGPFSLDGGKEVLFKRVGDQWQASVKDTLLAREETLPVIYQQDVATMLLALQGARKVDVASRIHVVAPDQALRCVYLGSLGVRGGVGKIIGKERGKGKQHAISNTRHETEHDQCNALSILGGHSQVRAATPSMSKTFDDSADSLHEMPMVLSRKTYYYIPLLNRIDMIQNYLMDTIDSFEKYLTGLRENNIEDVSGWQKFIQISVANTCKVVDKLYTYIGKLVVGKITTEACLHDAIMCREDYLMSHASHIDAWLYEECHELHNIVERVDDHFNHIALRSPSFKTPKRQRVLNSVSPLPENYKESTKIESGISALKGAIKKDIMSREECRGVRGAPDQLKDCFNNTNSQEAPAYVPIPTDKRLFKLFFPEDAKIKEGVRELKEAIRGDMTFRLETINSIIVMLFNICKLENLVNEETIDLLHHASTRGLWPKFLDKKSDPIDHPDGSTPLNTLVSLLEKTDCNYTTQPNSVFQNIILEDKLDSVHCVFSYFKMKYRNDGAALIKAVHFAQVQQWFNNRAVQMYNSNYVEGADMIGRMFLPYMGLGIAKEYPNSKQVPGVFALVSMFDRCRLAAEGQQTPVLLRPDFLIPEEVGDWQTPTKNIFSINNTYQAFEKEDDSTSSKTSVQEVYSKWFSEQRLCHAQSAARDIQKVWRERSHRENLARINAIAGTASEYLTHDSSGENVAIAREQKILGNKQEKILNDLFSDNSQLVKYRDYKNVWERLGGRIRSTAGGSHQELCNINGDVLGGIFKHNNNQTYGKRCVEKLLRRPMRRLMATRNLYIRDGRVVYESDSSSI